MRGKDGDTPTLLQRVLPTRMVAGVEGEEEIAILKKYAWIEKDKKKYYTHSYKQKNTQRIRHL